MATYAIGDIQGCQEALLRLLDQIRFNPESDRIWLVGDLVNRGPDSLATLRFVRSLGRAAVSVLGNHDLYLMMVVEGGAKYRGKDDTLQSILDAPDRDELIAWLRQRPLCHAEDNFCMVHAGLLPQWTTGDALRLSLEVQSALQGDQYHEFILNLWGSDPAAWSDELSGWPRLRVIVNAMTRMRFCTPDGQMEFHTKGKPQNAPPGHLPWFAVPNRRSADAVMVTGHWSALGLHVSPKLISLDTGCLWGGHLTAVRLADRQLFQVSCPK